jgi:polyferredoxin
MTQPVPDPWGFDEEPVETWADILGPQSLDLALLAAFLLLALVSFRSKSPRLKYVTLLASVGYLGFAKSYLISITNVFSVLDWNLPVVKYNLAFYLFAGFTIVSTILWGRLYCGRVCAFGALTQMMDAVLPASWRVEVPKALERRASFIKFGLLASVVAYYLVTHNLLVYQYVEPFWMYGMVGRTPLWIGLAVLLLATVFVRNLYCRFLCPVGAALGLLSLLTVFRIKRWSECSTCKICEKTCEWGAIQGPAILVTECVRCDDCERVYADTAKCPHWLIPIRRAEKGMIPLKPVGR